jgi:hypothetical protein
MDEIILALEGIIDLFHRLRTDYFSFIRNGNQMQGEEI